MRVYDLQFIDLVKYRNISSKAIVVNHDDEEREYDYMYGTIKATAHADSIGWHIVSMKKEFKMAFKNRGKK